MCCFSGPIIHVSGTRIFARLAEGRQLTAYQMTFAAAAEVAMVLPIPVPVGTDERAVRFIDLSDDPWFFSTLQLAFPRDDVDLAEEPRAGLAVDEGSSGLAIETVGAFEASFVPGARDFERLDSRFRLSADVLKALPGCADWGFVVFKLRAGQAEHDVHPMAFDFPTREPGRAFFPCVHVHDGQVHSEASFDHHLFAQLPAPLAALPGTWLRSNGVLGESRRNGAHDLVAPGMLAWSKRLHGMLPNQDVWLEPVPESAEDAELRAQSQARAAAALRAQAAREAELRRNARLARIGRAIVATPLCAALGFLLYIAMLSHLRRDRGGTYGAVAFAAAWLPSLWVVVETFTGRARIAWIATALAAAALGATLGFLP
jgi:hypothetical protein